MKIELQHVFLLLLLLSLPLLTACSPPEDKAAGHFQRALQYVEEEQYKAAVIEFRNVLQLEPKHAEAQYRLGLAYLKIGEVRHGFLALQRVVDLDPANHDALIKVAELYYLARESERSRLLLDRIPADSAYYPAALTLLANIEMREMNYNEAEEALGQALALRPEEAHLHVLQAKLFSLTGRPERAGEALVAALRLEPGWFSTHQLLVNHYLLNGMTAAAERHLAEVVGLFPNRLEPLMMQAQVYLGEGKKDAARDVLLEARRRFPREAAVVIKLAEIAKRGGDLAGAEEMLVESLGQVEEPLAVKVYLANFYFDVKKYADGEKLAAEILQDDPGNRHASLLQAELLRVKGKSGEALRLVEELLDAYPRWGEAHLEAGLVCLALGQVERSHKHALEAVEYMPAGSRARTLAARHALRKGEAARARELAAEALQLEPRNIQAAILLGRTHVAEEEPRKALAVFAKMNELLPGNADILYNLALASQALGLAEQSLRQAEEALEEEPRHPGALGVVAEALLETQGEEAMLARVERQLHITSRSSGQLRLLGEFLVRLEHYGEAKDIFQELRDLDGDDPSNYMMLARLQHELGNGESAIAEYRRLLERQPANLTARMSLGALLEQAGRRDEAREQYREALTIRKTFAPAANNLAWLIVEEENGDLDRALALALAAKEALPTEAAVSDTLGLVYFKRKAYDLALQQFQQAVAGEEENPTMRWHLARALLGKGELRQARLEVERALRSSEAFAGRAEARAMLESLE